MDKLLEMIKEKRHFSTIKEKAQFLRDNGVITARELKIINAFLSNN